MTTGLTRGIVDFGAGLRRGADLTIASGAVTLVEGSHAIDTVAGANTSDLETINPGVVENGGLILIYAANTSRTIVVKHRFDEFQPGNIILQGGSDILLDDTIKSVLLRRDGDFMRDITSQPEVTSGFEFIEEKHVFDVSELDFTNLDWNAFASYRINLTFGHASVGAGIDLIMRFFQGGLQTGGNYSSHIFPTQIVSNEGFELRVASNVYKGSNSHDEMATGFIEIFPPIGPSGKFNGTSFISRFAHNVGGSGNMFQTHAAGQFQLNENVVDGIRLSMRTSTFAEIDAKLWGFRK